MTLALRDEPNPQRLSDQVCTAINRYLIGGELHDLEQIHFGVPFFGRGVDITDVDFFTFGDHARLPEVYRILGLDIDPATTYSIPDGFQVSAQAADILANSLHQTQNDTHQKIACLLDWLFSQSKNTIVDFSDEDMYEMGIQPLAWEPSDLEFNNLMHAEAAQIIGDAMQGLDLLLADESLQVELTANVAIVSKALRKETKHDRYQADAERFSRSLRWTDRPQQPDEQRPANDTPYLPVRGADAA